MPSRSEICRSHGDPDRRKLDSFCVKSLTPPAWIAESMATRVASLADLMANPASQEAPGVLERAHAPWDHTRGLAFCHLSEGRSARCWRCAYGPSMEPTAQHPGEIGRLCRVSREPGAAGGAPRPRQAEGPHKSNRERSSYEQCSPLSLSPRCSGWSSLGSGFRSANTN